MKQRMRDGKRSGWTCLPCANTRAKARRDNSPDSWMDAKLWTFYRIRLTDYRAMYEAQGGRCAACGGTGSGEYGFDRKALVIDHDHSCCPGTRQQTRICGRCVRGLLCQQCNIALGMVNDSVDRLRALIAYVVSH